MLIAGVLLVGACSSSGSSSSSSSSSSSGVPAPEQLRASDAEVATGLRQIDTIAKGIAASTGIDKAHATDLAGQIEPVWEEIEGTVKANDSNTYLSFEDAFATLKSAAASGDSASAETAATNVSASVSLYLAAHPG